MKLEELKEQEELNESLFSKEDFSYRLEEWKRDEVDHLYITGLSGSGKSTLARSLAQRYNAEHIEDDLTIEYAEQYGYNFDDIEKADEETVFAIQEDILDRMITGKRAVIESIWVPYYSWNRFPTNSVYIVKTGRLKATYRGSKRDEIKNPIEYLLRFFDTKEYWNKITQLEQYLKRMKT